MENAANFVDTLHDYIVIGELIFVGLAVLVLLGYWIGLLATGNQKKKYDYIAKNEIKYLRIAAFFVVLALILFLDDLLATQFEIVETAPFLGGAFVILMLGVMIYSGISTTLRIYYPKYVGKRLDNIRYSERTNPKTGNRMKLLNEEEEDVYLTEEMQMDEKDLKFDYDVWIDEATGDVQIEKYDAREGAMICPSCNFRTLKDVGEEVLSSEVGEEILIRHYECSYCGRLEKKEFKVSKVDSGSTQTA